MTTKSDSPAGGRNSISRRALLTASAAIGGAAAFGLALSDGGERASATPQADRNAARRRASRFRNSLSISPFTEFVLATSALKAGTFTTSRLPGVQTLFDRAGATEVYARVATRDDASDNKGGGATRAVERARIAKAMGKPFNPELGLWAYYGDIAMQPGPDFRDYPSITLPDVWEKLTIDQMASALKKYGRAVAQQILSTGVKVNTWDIGNEVEFGVAGVAIPSFSSSDSHGWTYAAPDAVNPAIGQMSAYALFGMSEADRNAWLSTNLWPYVGKLLKATADGVRSVDPHAKFATHTSVVGLQLPGLLTAFWEAMDKAGFRSEVLGTSFYPTSNASTTNPLDSFKSTAAELQAAFGRPLFLAETAYPSATMTAPEYATWNTPVPNYPLSPAGQAAFFTDLTEWGVTSGLLSGIRLWAPDYCTGEWTPMSCFDAPVNGVASAKPVLTAVRAGAARAVR